jgi:hypothetical protein
MEKYNVRNKGACPTEYSLKRHTAASGTPFNCARLRVSKSRAWLESRFAAATMLYGKKHSRALRLTKPTWMKAKDLNNSSKAGGFFVAARKHCQGFFRQNRSVFVAVCFLGCPHFILSFSLRARASLVPMCPPLHFLLTCSLHVFACSPEQPMVDLKPCRWNSRCWILGDALGQG